MSTKCEFGTAFCHLAPSLVDDQRRQQRLASDISEDDLHYDEYGFKLHGPPPTEDVILQEEDLYNSVRARWMNYLESESRKLAPASMLDLSRFEAIDLERTAALDQLITSGITNQLRPFFWLRLSHTLHLKIESTWSFTQLCDQSANITEITLQQATQVLPNNACFASPDSMCCVRLQRILRTLTWYHKTHNISNDDSSSESNSLNLSLIGAYLLLLCNEDDSFWLLLKISLELKPSRCIEVIRQLITKCCPVVAGLLKQHQIELSLVVSNWIASLFAGLSSPSLPAKQLYILWDLYFYEGPVFLVQIVLGLLIIETQSLQLSAESDSDHFFNTLSDLPCHSFRSLHKLTRAWRTGQSIMTNVTLPADMYHYEATAEVQLTAVPDDPRLKNVKQTSLMVNLHRAIVALGRHFEAYDLLAKYKLEADYSHVDKSDGAEDLNNRLRPYRRKRAKALIDFNKNDNDELGFRQNDIITVIDERDEHCWIGELNGTIGWFPAKFVELLDERDQDYNIAGDDRVVPFVNDLVRGRLCAALKAILTYDMKKSYFVHYHPWTIIEEIADLNTNADLKSVYVRLVLTKTFQLDKFERVLTPAELLYRSIAMVNRSHQQAPLDIKFRSLITMGLNQFVLHEWFELICTSHPSVIRKAYGPNSFLLNPVWKLIKAELKLLVQFPFHLNPDAELEMGKEPKSPVTKEGVCDMLVKYHLFSWDI